MSERNRKLWVIGSAGTFIILLIATGYVLKGVRAPAKARWQQVNVGDSEEKVLALLGTPEFIFKGTDQAVDYYVEGYARRERSITNKVLIYRAADMILYVWLDHSGKVEEVFIGTS